jgi:hypothetical protein
MVCIRTAAAADVQCKHSRPHTDEGEHLRRPAPDDAGVPVPVFAQAQSNSNAAASIAFERNKLTGGPLRDERVVV